MTCSLADCSNPAYARGWCKKHYQRVHRHGSPHIALRFTNDGAVINLRPFRATPWIELAACRDKPNDVFFPSKDDPRGVHESYVRARRICAGCPVKDACLQYALDERITHGVFGGTSPRERFQMAKGRAS